MEFTKLLYKRQFKTIILDTICMIPYFATILLFKRNLLKGIPNVIVVFFSLIYILTYFMIRSVSKSNRMVKCNIGLIYFTSDILKRRPFIDCEISEFTTFDQYYHLIHTEIDRTIKQKLIHSTKLIDIEPLLNYQPNDKISQEFVYQYFIHFKYQIIISVLSILFYGACLILFQLTLIRTFLLSILFFVVYIYFITFVFDINKIKQYNSLSNFYNQTFLKNIFKFRSENALSLFIYPLLRINEF